MSSRKNVQDAHITHQVRVLHDALIDIASLMNQPQRDEELVHEAGISLDRALLSLLVGIERLGPIGIVDLANRTGRDYTTVSRQVTKLESLDLAERRQSAADRRVNEAVITARGKAMTERLDAARERILCDIFETWDEHDIGELVRLMAKFAKAATKEPEAPSQPKEEV